MKLTSKLSFILGLRSLVLVLLLGFVMSFFQTYFDFKNRYEEVNLSIDSIVDSSKASASRAVYHIDPNLAEQIIKGLTHFDYFSYVGLYDERGQVMAEYSREGDVFVIPILSFFADNYRDLEAPVGEGKFTGRLVIRVNLHMALSQVYDRAVRTFGISLLGYMGLSLALALLYHNSLAVPLTRLSKRLQRVNTSSITDQSIAHIKGNETNEFSLIVDSANDLLSRIASGQLLLTQRSQRFRLILDTAPLLVFAIGSDGKFVFANKSTAAFYGYSIFDLKGKSADLVIGEFDEKLNRFINKFITSNDRQLTDTVAMHDASSQRTINEISLVKFHTFDGQSILVVCNDVTKRVDAETEIESLAYKDPLTHLPNRNKVYDLLNWDSDKNASDYYHVAILADLDQFKRINDTLSHSVGDMLIVTLAKRLSKEFEDYGLVARLGADEFLHFRENVSRDLDIANAAAHELGEKLRLCINQDIALSTQNYALSASVGVVVFKQGEQNVDLILQYADTAMYESKKKGRNCVTLFEESMAMQAAKLLQLETDITNAMVKDQFNFVLQPIVSSVDNSVVSAEALIRWYKDDEVIPPDHFIPFLEESSLIIEVGAIMLNKVCDYLSKLQQESRLADGFRVAVNISGRQFSENQFIARITSILRRYQISGEYLEFEITESVALENLQDTISKILELKKLGISFSLDDFGTGYSSLSHLKDLPVDKLKIDRSFINDISIDKQDENLVRSIIQLAENLSLTTVAEGVETRQQVEWLKGTGDLLLQGFYFSRPIKPEDFNQQFIK